MVKLGGGRHTPEAIERITLKGEKWRKENPTDSYESSLKGWQNSVYSGIVYGRKTGIERKTQEQLEQRGWDFNFSQILGRKYQFDFRIGNNILLEVHGDYWHGSPTKYGNGKKPLNQQQQNKIRQDIKKQKFAEENGWKLFVIWEHQVNSGDWAILEEIQNELNAV